MRIARNFALFMVAFACASAFYGVPSDARQLGDVPSGAVMAFIGTAVPSGWIEANGALLPSEARYRSLCAQLGSQFALPTDPVGSCRLPDLRGRVAMGAGVGESPAGSLTARAVGQKVGSETAQLGVAELPAHRHGLSSLKNIVAAQTSGWAVAAQRDTVGPLTADLVTDSSGGGSPFAIIPPSLVVRYLVRI